MPKYTPKLGDDGQPVLTDEGWLFEDADGREFHFDPDSLMGKVSRLGTEAKNHRLAREKAETAAARAAILDELEITDEDELRKALEAFRAKPPATPGESEVEKIRASIQRDHQKALDKLAKDHATERETITRERDALREAIEEAFIEGDAAQAFAELGGRAKGLRVLRPHIRAVAKVVQEVDEETGKITFARRVLDEEGQERYSPASKKPLTIRELLEEMRDTEEFGAFFEGKGYAGTGAPSGRPGVPRGGRVAADDRVAIAKNFDSIAEGSVTVNG